MVIILINFVLVRKLGIPSHICCPVSVVSFQLYLWFACCHAYLPESGEQKARQNCFVPLFS